jgi:hypothetical protein
MLLTARQPSRDLYLEEQELLLKGHLTTMPLVTCTKSQGNLHLGLVWRKNCGFCNQLEKIKGVNVLFTSLPTSPS